MTNPQTTPDPEAYEAMREAVKAAMNFIRNRHNIGRQVRAARRLEVLQQLVDAALKGNAL
jgi:hypothetical protein